MEQVLRVIPHLYIGSLKNRCQPRQPVKLSAVGLCSFGGLMFVNQVSMFFLPFSLIFAWGLCLKAFSHAFSCWFYICLHLHIFVKKRTYVLVQMHLCFSLNALAFWFKRTCVWFECTCVLENRILQLMMMLPTVTFVVLWFNRIRCNSSSFGVKTPYLVSKLLSFSLKIQMNTLSLCMSNCTLSA